MRKLFGLVFGVSLLIELIDRRLVFSPPDHRVNRMKNDVIPVEIRGILPANSGCAIFVGNDEKVFVIQVEHNMGAVIGMFLRDTPKERPLTHDLIASIFKGFNVTVERAVITDLKNSTYFARLILQQENELGRKIVEIDARPSDCLALVTAQKRPLFVATSLFHQVEDMSKWLEEINENGGGESE
jgi:bifunctional DNase/RNase